MSLTPGVRLGVYEIQAPLGAGGMGEVYRARDTRLGRDVAIKVLPNAFTRDAERLARFEREARVLASLNHPHIAAIYGVEERAPQAGSEQVGITALVLELVEGETLADRLTRGAGPKAHGLPLTDSLAIARQIADALDAAHEKGIVHRDLKPGNIMVTAVGVVKVLDFGLAKSSDTTPAPDLTHSPTMTVDGTERGVLLGTAPYMSPEQARGQAVDKRADIWAFGCVLYELLTGRKAFRGDTTSDTLAAILEREPDWTALPDATPARVRELLRRCLTKNLSRRLRDVGDATLDLDAALVLQDQPTGPSTRVVLGVSRVWLGAAAAALLAAGLAAGLAVRGTTPPTPAPALAIGPLVRLTSDSGLATDPSVSADGRLVAYASNRGGAGMDIYVQQTTGGTAIRLTEDAADDREPAVSPDGSVVAFRSERSPPGLYVASALGGGSRLIAPDGRAPKFSPDGRSIAFWTGPWSPRGVDSAGQTFIMPAAGGSPTRVAANLAYAGDPVWAPDGRSLMVFGREAASGTNIAPDWWWVPVDGGAAVRTGIYERFTAQQIRVDDLQTYPHDWTAEGVLFSARTDSGETKSLWLVPVDPRSGRATGDPLRLTNGTTSDESVTISRAGQMVISAQTVFNQIFVLPLDENGGRPTGGLRRVRDDTKSTGRASVSEDGRLLVFPMYEFGSGGVWVRDLQTGQERQLAATPRTPLNPVMSVDGRWVAYTVTTVDTGGGGGPGDGYVVETSGGVPRRVCESCQVDLWVKNNRAVVINERTALVRVDIATGNRVPLVTVSAGLLDRPMFGPNGRWMTFNLTRRGIFVAPVYVDRASEEAEWTQVIATDGTVGRTAGLSPSGGLLYVLLERDGFRCLYALRLDPTTGQPRGELFLVAHFHDATKRWGSTGYGSAVAHGVFLANLSDATGNLWMTTLARRQ